MELSEEEDRGDSEWERVVRGRKDRRKRKKKDGDSGSAGGTESEGREDERKGMKVGLLNVVVRFEEEGEVKKVDPLKLTKIIRGQIGEVKYARENRNGICFDRV